MESEAVKDYSNGFPQVTIEEMKMIEEMRNKVKKNPKDSKKNSSDDEYYDSLKKAILITYADKKTNKASEMIVQYILEHNKIYTTRNDEKTELWIYEEGIYVPNGKTYIREMCRDILFEAYTANFATKIIEKIETDTYVEQDIFFDHNYLDEIAIKNGLLNIKTRELNEFTPDKIFFNKLPLVYDPSKECKKIETFFKSVLKEDDIAVIEELFGYLLYKEYLIEKAIMFSGGGRNGKGKMINLMECFIGIENTTNLSLHQLEKNQYEIAGLKNKMANLAGDISKEEICRSSVIKGLTGRDRKDVQRKFLTNIKFKNYAKMIFSANELPLSKDDTLAFWDRWILIEFPYTFRSKKTYDAIPKEERENIKIRNPLIVDEITNPNEMSGLLNVALNGLDRLLKNNSFSYSQSTEEVKNAWLRKSDSFMGFMLDYIEDDYESRIEKKEMKAKYVSFCRMHKLKICSDDILKKILTSNTSVIDTRKSINGNKLSFWEGIKFKKKLTLDRVDRTDILFQAIGTIQKEPKSEKTLSNLSVLSASSDNIQTFILALDSKKTDWQTLSAKFGENAIQKAMDEGLIYEANPNQIKVLEENK